MMMEAYRIMVRGRSLFIRNWKCCPRRSTSSAKQSRDHKSELSSKKKITDDHTSMDKHQVERRQKRVEKYLRKKLLPPH